MKGSGYNLKDRDRLMALVFALRLTVLSLFLILVSEALLPLIGAEAPQSVALLGLFSIFLFFVSVVLNARNFSGNLNRALLACPTLLFIAPNDAMFLLLAYATGILFLAAFYREARTAERERPFLLSLVWWIVILGLNLPSLFQQRALKPWTLLSTAVLMPIFLAFSCWVWQQGLREIMGALDSDEDSA